jgi:hypothetical protein
MTCMAFTPPRMVLSLSAITRQRSPSSSGEAKAASVNVGCQCVARENSLIELDEVTLPVVLRNLHEYDNQPSDTCTGFDH